jgi:hypothetical protein
MALPSSVSVELRNLGYGGNASVGAVVASGNKLVPGGFIGVTGTAGTPAVEPILSNEPEGVVSRKPGALIAGANGSLWIKTGVGENSTGWTLLIAGS